MSQAVIRINGLKKTFYSGFFGNIPTLRTLEIGKLQRVVHAVQGVNLEVYSGEIFAFLGPNGAGKSTTLKMLTGLIQPTAGEGTLLGHPLGSPQSRHGLGYLPENPVFYDELTPLELMKLSGALLGLNKQESINQGGELLERLSMAHAINRPLRKLSKGMHQRVGLAQALLANPRLLILDEPFSGLDPIGRQEVRDLLLDYRQKGTALFFSSHILADVEALCDRFALIDQGQLLHQGRLDDLEAETTQIEVVIEYISSSNQLLEDIISDQLDRLVQRFHTLSNYSLLLTPLHLHPTRFKTRLPLSLQNHFIDFIQSSEFKENISLLRLNPVRPSLEDLFIQKTNSSSSSSTSSF